MRKLGITSERRSINVKAIKAYNDIFRSPLWTSCRKVIRTFFMANCPKLSVEAMDIES
jgi:hypothetical protein